jgi:recombination protein RecT
MTNAEPVKEEHPLVKFKAQLDMRQKDFLSTLPAHIPAERFSRVILTAVQQNKALLWADRQSLFASAMKAASDGLLCDGREAALVIYNTKDGKDEKGRDVWVQKVQYMTMVAGILKKCRNSGELSTIVAKVVYGGDKFRNWIDDAGEHLEYEAGEDQDRNIVRNCFAMAKLKDGSIEAEVLKPADIEKIRSVSRAKNSGPWVDWWEEMAKKSAIRRLSKRLPLSTDLDDLIRRDDTLYDLDGARDEVRGGDKLSLASKYDLIVAGKTQGQATKVGPDRRDNPPPHETKSESGGGSPEVTEASRSAPVANTDAGAANASGSFSQNEQASTAPASSDTHHAKGKGRAGGKQAQAPDKQERDALILGDLLRQGDTLAKQSEGELTEWLYNLNADEQAMITPDQEERWLTIARSGAEL